MTDGDVRRSIEEYGDGLFSTHAHNLASRHPLSVREGTRVEKARELIERHKVGCLLVFDSKSELVGIFRK